MRNSISIFVLIISSFIAFGQFPGQKDTLRFAPDSSYSRAIVRFKKDQLLFGTSKSGVIGYNEKTKQTIPILPRNPNGEFRDLAFFGKNICGMVSGDNGVIDETMNSSATAMVEDPSVFYDDIVRYKNVLIVLGDPVEGRFFLKKAPISLSSTTFSLHLPTIKNQPDEACYAASGTTAQLVGKSDYVFVSGGKQSARFHRFDLLDSSTYFVRDLPMVKGEGAGPFSVCFTDEKHGAIVGGNYLQPKDTSGTCVYTEDGGKTWLKSTVSPNGYRSCVTGNKRILFSCGTTGIDYSQDGGKTWYEFDSGNYCALLLEKGALYATTNKGVCIRYKLSKKPDKSRVICGYGME
ncbi:MAG: hypothetical protein A3D31_05910 [Candidatus Fluviicola riflensis]|nr:MAG: hypothetical protein CHH17_09105 [Candidatus Fluviicola riflensis]OGS79502.1 MAG: hypothetical protein A3D31_05910 [Candidatus Fluviicola riflensis]OGS86933.1 MAG: hypothetical protein A2724_05370 [Fluviicola sp. RIFCSPHIGHO2_01_FULL_43_53]OGS89724.1 MAG: hypothetical protein A3E30_02115 [Fluviicola sp. RIFCSPHIGHO2_12_FULL_43_24]